MKDKEIASPAHPSFCGADADKLIACADGNAALLYLHFLRIGTFSLSAAARDLRKGEDEIALAADTLRRLGIMPEAAPALEGELPEYKTEEITQKAKSDSSFEAIVFECERALGKMLSTNDLRILLGIYDHLGLPAEVIALLINHCIETHRAAYGEGRMPTMRQIEKEAWHWVRTEVLTLDMAEQHIDRERLRAEDTEQVRAALQIRGRALTPTEQKYISSWLDMGFSPDALAIAYDRTVISTGKLVWKYMDKIIQSWHEKKLHTPEEIAEGDAPRKSVLPRQGAAAGGSDVENMRRMFSSQRKKDEK